MKYQVQVITASATITCGIDSRDGHSRQAKPAGRTGVAAASLSATTSMSSSSETSMVVDSGIPLLSQVVGQGRQHSVHKAAAIVGGEALSQLDCFVEDNRDGHLWALC